MLSVWERERGREWEYTCIHVKWKSANMTGKHSSLLLYCARGGITNCSLLETLPSPGSQDTALLLLFLPPSCPLLHTPLGSVPILFSFSDFHPAHPLERLKCHCTSQHWLQFWRLEVISNHWLDMIKARSLGADAGPSLVMAVWSTDSF